MLVIQLNITGLNIPIIQHRLADLRKKLYAALKDTP